MQGYVKKIFKISKVSPQAWPQPAVPFLRTLPHTAVAPLKIGVVDKHAEIGTKYAEKGRFDSTCTFCTRLTVFKLGPIHDKIFLFCPRQNLEPQF